MLTTKQKLREIISRMRFNWWRNSSERRFKTIGCLCVMCHQERQAKPGLVASHYDGWCDECFCELPLWLKFKTTTADELKELAGKQKEAADIKRERREANARMIAARKKKKAKLTGFENVEDEEPPIVISDADIAEVKTNYEEQRQQLESIFYYDSND